MNKIVDIVLTTLNNLNNVGTVIYDSGFSTNLRIDRAEPPYVLLYLINEWRMDLQKAPSIKEGADLQVFFFKPVDYNAKGEEKDIVVREMYSIAEEFVSKILQVKELNLVNDELVVNSSYGKFDKFCAGVVVNLTLKEIQGHCI